MADDPFQAALQRTQDYLRGLSAKSTEERVAERRLLKEKEGNLERELNQVETQLIILDAMPDVAKYIAIRDKMAMAMLTELRDAGDIPYNHIGPYLGIKNKADERVIIPHYTTLLRVAELIVIDNDVVKVTAEGRTADYIEE